MFRKITNFNLYKLKYNNFQKFENFKDLKFEN